MNTKLLYFYNLISALLPHSHFFYLKNAILRLSGAKIGARVRIMSSSRFINESHLVIGDNTFIGHQVLFTGGKTTITIGKNVDVAPRVTFVTGSHKIDWHNEKVAGEGYSAPIKIANGCWIGCGAIILGGTELGENCIVAAGSVVKGKFPSKSLIGGVPGKILNINS